MQYLHFFQKQWNLVLGIATAIVAALTNVIIPPTFAISFIESQISLIAISRLGVAFLIVIILIPFGKYRSKRLVWLYWGITLLLFCATIYIYSGYNQNLSRRTAYNKYSNERVIIGKTLLPIAQKAVDSAARLQIHELASEDLIEKVGSPSDVWPYTELRENATYLFGYYLLTVVMTALSILTAIQAIYCTTTKSS